MSGDKVVRITGDRRLLAAVGHVDVLVGALGVLRGDAGSARLPSATP